MVLKSKFAQIRSLTKYIAITKLISLYLNGLLPRHSALLLMALIKTIKEWILKRLWLKLCRISLIGQVL
jgi:hypothetical protein